MTSPATIPFSLAGLEFTTVTSAPLASSGSLCCFRRSAVSVRTLMPMWGGLLGTHRNRSKQHQQNDKANRCSDAKHSLPPSQSSLIVLAPATISLTRRSPSAPVALQRGEPRESSGRRSGGVSEAAPWYMDPITARTRSRDFPATAANSRTITTVRPPTSSALFRSDAPAVGRTHQHFE